MGHSEEDAECSQNTSSNENAFVESEENFGIDLI